MDYSYEQSNENSSQQAESTDALPLPNHSASIGEARGTAHPAVAFLHALGKDPASTYFRTLDGKSANRSRRGADLHGFDAQALERDNTQANVYAVIGNATAATGRSGAVTDADVPTMPALFCEWDDRPIDWQITAWLELGLPEPTIQVLTGGKSVHSYWLLDQPMPAAEWRVLQRRLLAHCNADSSICNPARVMRLPGFSHKATGNTAEVVHTTTTRYSASALEACLPPVVEQPPLPAPSTAHAPPHRGTSSTLEPRSRQEIDAAAQFIPQRTPGGGTYPSDRNALCGLSAALEEAGSSNPDGEALDILGSSWPSLRAAQQVLDSTHTRNAASFWAIAAEHGYTLKRTPTRTVQVARPAAPSKADQTPLSREQKLAQLQADAAALLATKTAYALRLPLLRGKAEDLSINLRDQELQNMLTAARRARTGSDKALATGDWLDVTPTAWLWEDILMRGRLNLLIAMPKQGKTSLVLSYIAAHHSRQPAFLDKTLHGPCPPVLIVGTDQGANDWGQMLEQTGLSERQGDRVRISEPIIGLHHAGRALHLDPEGIDHIAAYAQANPGLLIVIDSLSACVATLGLKEESAQIAEPIHDLMSQVEPHGATVVLIHHASKGHAGEAASMASRGSTALPAVASQTIKLGPATAGSTDTRRLLSTEGRGGAPAQLVIQRDGGTWGYLGNAEMLQQESAAADLQRKLTDKQADALDVVEERWAEGMQRTNAAHLVEELGLAGKDSRIHALKTLKALERRGLLSSIQSKATQTSGRPPIEFWPKSAGAVEGAASRTRTYLPEPMAEMATMVKTPLAPEDPHRINSLFSSGGEVSTIVTISAIGSEKLGEKGRNPLVDGRNPSDDGRNPSTTDSVTVDTSSVEVPQAVTNQQWHPLLLDLKARFGHESPATLALRLQVEGGFTVSGRDVKAALEVHS